ncbi:DEAD/DEAH box helicase [Selenomonas sp. oral taxon 138]|uniref:DEAD/DEAH box helicase n=1 Tax=Selenomonas sp. oral taxon 138 TaxID=712532 RepID=UPI0002A3C56A|nr:DEAD/DEAH box helicase [Selenomonas sp. oral taxon 138]EKY00532.1 helicase protein [Selenomonas sp. oral taxon 138 str. F0429]
MNKFRDVSFGEYLFSKIDNNKYLQKLYQNILINYSKRLFNLSDPEDPPVNIEDALTFIDVLSKSSGTSLSDTHKTRAQEMIALLYDMYPQNEDIQYCLGSVLATTCNFLGMKRLTPDFKSASLLEQILTHFNRNYLSVPSDEEAAFFPAQKEIFDSLSKPYFSYSAPTSMGKSYMMRVFIKQQLMKGTKKNFALLIPTKALINEVTNELIDNLTTLLQETNYRIVTSSGSIALETEHNYIFILTQERMLYILIDDPELKIDYLFVDEAHKISSSDKRSVFYYKVITKLEERQSTPHIIFASPNIPNPKIFLDILSKKAYLRTENSTATCKYAPVSQVKYIVDLWERNIRIFDSYTKKFLKFYEMPRPYSLSELIVWIGDRKHNIVYCKSKNDAIQFARNYAKTQEVVGDKKLQSFAEAIRRDVHKEYYLAELVEKGVAYHIGYLPANIRMQLENYYREGLIKTIFCTSTLLEGINLPAENLFITSYKKGISRFSEVDFKNLIGRVGRAKYNLYGNVFVVRLETHEAEIDLKNFENLLIADVPPQKLSIEAELKSNQKEFIVNTLLSGNVEIHKTPKDQSEDNYDLMRKTMLILVGDIVNHQNSRVRREFSPYLTPEIEEKIRAEFSVTGKKPDDDINVSYDQIQGIKELIRNGLSYPKIHDLKGGANYQEALTFLNKLAVAFKWRIYENQTLGAGEGDHYSKLTWYTVLLLQWMQGYGLSYIIERSITDYAEKRREVRVDYKEKEVFNGSQKHKNIIIADTLEAIENVLLFRLSSYFLRFSEEYRRQHPDDPFTNNWYEFIEYGTTNHLRILLQRSGFRRESTEYIRRHADKYVRGSSDRPKLLKRPLLDSPNELVKRDTEYIQYNIPELFLDEGEE